VLWDSSQRFLWMEDITFRGSILYQISPQIAVPSITRATLALVRRSSGSGADVVEVTEGGFVTLQSRLRTKTRIDLQIVSSRLIERCIHRINRIISVACRSFWYCLDDLRVSVISKDAL
jgi:hypothetical protein